MIHLFDAVVMRTCDFRTQSLKRFLRTLLVLSIPPLAMAPAFADDHGNLEHCTHPKVSRQALKNSIKCNVDLRTANRTPVLLVAGTTFTPDINFGWNYIPALTARGHPVCTVEVPENSLGDIQVAAVYIAYGIRKAYSRSGRKVAVLGFSQGGMSPRWTFRFFPDTRQKVEDLVALAPSNHGSSGLAPPCTDFPSADPDGIVGCESALWQQLRKSRFLATLNRRFETVSEVDYSVIYSTFDGLLVENAGPRPTSALRSEAPNVANLSLQSLCSANIADHFATGTFDPVAYAMVIDALEHDGPANLERLLDGAMPGSHPICAEVFMPGVDPSAFLDNFTALFDFLVASLDSGKHVTEEPELSCRARAPAPAGG